MKKTIKTFAQGKVGDINDLVRRIKKRDFTGNTGQAIRNSIYQFTTSLVSKIGSLIFTAVIARLFLPELFGLYSLALGTIVFFSAFSDLGLDSAMITFIAKTLEDKKQGKSKSYLILLGRIKLWATMTISAILLFSAYFLAHHYYNKPIFFALLAGGLYLPFSSLARFLETTYTAANNFKEPLIKEILFQIIRILFVPLLIYYVSKQGYSNETIVAYSIIALSLCYLFSFIYLWKRAKKKLPFLSVEKRALSDKELERVKRFTLPMTVTILSGVFFGYIDTLMLGRYVTEEFIGYYGAAFSLVSSAMTLIGFTAVATYPIFARLKGKSLKRAFNKVYNFSLFISLIGAIITFIGAKYFIVIIYGQAFLPAALFLRYLSVLIVIGTSIGIYMNYFLSQEKTRLFSETLIGVTILNIVLNYFFIKYGLRTSMTQAVIGACIAVIITKVIYVALLSFLSRSKMVNKN